MKWYFKIIISLLIISFVVGMAYREVIIRDTPLYARKKQEMVQDIFSDATITRLKNSSWGRQIDLDLRGRPDWLLYWTGKCLEYANPNIPDNESNGGLNLKLANLRLRPDSRDPLVILEHGVGRCEEFSIVYGAFLKGAGFNVRLVYDFSTGVSEAGKRNGDHVWVEIDWLPRGATLEQTQQRFRDGFYWTHIEPTDGAIEAVKVTESPDYDSYSFASNKYINDPEMYERDRLKELTNVWAVAQNHTRNVTENYQYEEES